MKLKDLMTSQYDVVNDKITAPRNTVLWWHEARHRWQSRQSWFRSYAVLEPAFLTLAVVAWTPWPVVAVLGMLVYCEVDAWIYAARVSKRRQARRTAAQRRAEKQRLELTLALNAAGRAWKEAGSVKAFIGSLEGKTPKTPLGARSGENKARRR